MTAARFLSLGSAVFAATLIALIAASPTVIAKAPKAYHFGGNGPLLAQLRAAPTKIAQKKRRKSKKSSKKRRRGVRKKILSSEAGTKKGQSTKIDFDEASIDGRRRAPMGVAINKNKGNDDYDLIKLRLKWHQEMVDSAANLETGKNR